MTADHERFEALFERCYGPLLAYAIRRSPSAEDAADVVSDVFTVAWRRIGELPPGDEARLWLYGTARRVISSHRRGRSRRDAVDERLLADARTNFAHARHHSSGGERLSTALASLSESDQELLHLVAWEGLEAAQIARCLGITTAATHVRLHRARKRLRSRFEAQPPPRAVPAALPSTSPFVRATPSQEDA